MDHTNPSTVSREAEVVAVLGERRVEELVQALRARLSHTGWEDAVADTVNDAVERRIVQGSPLVLSEVLDTATPAAHSLLPRSVVNEINAQIIEALDNAK